MSIKNLYKSEGDKIKKNSGIYIHIPFCRNKCDYCSFYSIPSDNDNFVENYVQALLKEIDYISLQHGGAKTDTVYFGGGTPSLLEPGQVKRILTRISERFIPGTEPEITLEMNPEDLTYEKLDGFTDAGVNRIVLGVQTLDSEMRTEIGRRGKNISNSMFDLFFSHGGFTRCIDIIAGIHGQKEVQLLKDLETVTGYLPEHISLYLLSVDEETPLGKRFSPDEKFDDHQADLWGSAMDYLAKKGYIHYEISNYALPGFESRHNSKYWDFTPYYGFGSGAHSFIDGKRISNRLKVEDYINSSEFLYDVETPTANNVIVEFVMTSLRRMKGFGVEEFTAVTSRPLPADIRNKLEALKAEGMIEINNGRYYLTKNGLYYTDSIIYRIVENYL